MLIKTFSALILLLVKAVCAVTSSVKPTTTTTIRTTQACSSNSRLTFYWVAIQGTLDQAADGSEVLLTGPLQYPLVECSTKQNLTIVDKLTYDKCVLEGTCWVASPTGNTLKLNLGNGDPNKPCFLKLDSQWGLGSQDNPLSPLISVASNNILFGTKIYIPRFKGLLVGNVLHNGCFRVDDVGWSLSSCHLDVFAGTYTMYKSLFYNYPDYVSYQVQSNCTLLDYPIPMPSATVSTKASSTIASSTSIVKSSTVKSSTLAKILPSSSDKVTTRKFTTTKTTKKSKKTH